MANPPHESSRPTGHEVDLLGVWFRRVVQSDPSAFESLFRATRESLVRYAFQITGDEAAAADMVQEAFLRFWQRRREHDPSGSVKALLFRTVRNLALNSVRDGKRRAQLLAEGYEPPARATPDPDETLAGQELAGRIRGWMEELPDRQREALTLSRFQGLSHEEIAEVMGVAPRTVNNHLVRALRTLRDRIEAHREGSSVQGAG
ncbi:MAG: RNA polymerase sigma-70 factor [Gemmatimonadales bacterium]|nr:MAG: RNA polymerase sigma-70 factor [Gemmatimonadales bacterium]